MYRFVKFLPIAAFLAVFGFGSTASATSITDCPSGYSCIAANTTTQSSSSSSSSSYTKIVIKKTIKQDVEEYEHTTHKVVVFNQNLNHSSTHGLSNCHWGIANWSGWTLINGKRVFSSNGPHGRTHMCWDAHLHEWLQVGDCGEQLCCGNVVVPEGKPAPPKRERVVNIIHFKTRKQFKSTFEKWVSRQQQSSSTSSTSTVYSCSAGWTLHGAECWQQIPPPPCTNCGCNNSCPPPPCTNCGCNNSCPPPPPPPAPPTVTAVLSVQEMDTTAPNATSEEPVTADVTAPNGDQLKTVYSACYGRWPNGNVGTTTSTSSPFSYSAVYEAPTEVPNGTACANVPAGYDRITVYVYDLTTGLNNTTQSDGRNTTLVQITQPTPNPS